MPTKMCTCILVYLYTCMCFLQKGYEVYKANQTGVAHKVLSHHNEDNEDDVLLSGRGI